MATIINLVKNPVASQEESNLDKINEAIAAAAVSETVFTAFFGRFTVAHGLGYAPRHAVISLASLGQVVFQFPIKCDAANFYLEGSADGLNGSVLSWK